MATVKLFLDTRKEKRGGLYPVKLVVNHKSTSYIGIGISVTKEQWTGREVVYHPKSKLFNNELKSKLIRAENIILKLSTTGDIKKTTQKELLQFIATNDTEPVPKQDYLVQTHFEKYISQCKAKRTAEIYQNTLHKIQLFTPQLTFTQLNLSWLKSFDLHISKTCGINTRSIDMRNIRAVFNDAINEDLASMALYPFRGFKIKKEDTIKRNLTAEKLILLRGHPVLPHQQRYRDIFFLQFYLIGISIIDLLHLTWDNYVDGRIEYKRRKTGVFYSIKVIPEAMKIIKKYKGETHILSYMDSHTNYRAFASMMNEHLQQIGSIENGKLTPLFPKLTTYFSRHSWASLASSIDIPIETISAALGHKYGSETTIGYINFDQKKVDKANRDVVNLLSPPDS